MSEIKLPFRRVNLVLALLALVLSIQAEEVSYIGTSTHDEIEQRLEDLHAKVDLKLTPEVKKYLKDYVVSYRHSSEKLLGRSLMYFPDIDRKIKEKQVPTEIKYLSIVESSLKPSARSRVGAVGLWQFMKATARMYGLKIDKDVDERKDVDKSTEAALEYLKDLNERFGDWTLALAAYNCGPGNVRKAIRKSGGHDYWSIRSHLPRETRNYVPKFIAITYVMNYYSEHELDPQYPEELFIKTRKAKVFSPTTFTALSNITGMTVEEIKNYNPSYIGSHIPGTIQGRIIELPSLQMYTFLEATESLEHLIADPLQDLEEESKVAAQVLERREELAEIGQLPSIKLERSELLYSADKRLINATIGIREEMEIDLDIVKRKELTPIFDRKKTKKLKNKEMAAKVRKAIILR